MKPLTSTRVAITSILHDMRGILEHPSSSRPHHMGLWRSDFPAPYIVADAQGGTGAKLRTAGEDGENGGPYGILRHYPPPSFIERSRRPRLHGGDTPYRNSP